MDDDNDKYYEHEIWNSTIKDCDKTILFSVEAKHGVKIEDKILNEENSDHVSLYEYDKFINNLYYKLKNYTQDNNLPVLDKCSLYNFEQFLEKYMKSPN